MKTYTKFFLLLLIVFISSLNISAQNSCPEWQWADKAGMKGILSGANTKAIATDANGNSYVAGTFSGSAYFGDILFEGSVYYSKSFVGKINSDGKWLWVKAVDGSRENGASTIALDPTGNIYISGYFTDTAKFGNITLVASISQNKLYVAKLDNNGQWQWAAKTDGGATITSNGMAVDNNGNAYITGDFTSNSGNDVSFGSTKLASAGGRDIYLSKIDASGQWQWAVQAGGTSSDIGYGVALDATGNPYITGYFINTAKFGSTQLTSNTSGWNDAFIAKLNTSGQWQWTVKAGGSRGVVGNGITIDGSGNVYVTGGFVNSATFGSTTLTSAGDDDLFVTKLNNNGQWQWAVNYGSTNEEIGYGIKADGTGNIFVLGNIYNSVLLNKYNSSNGQLLTAMKPNYTGTVRGFDLGAGDNAYFAGYNSSSSDPAINFIKFNHKDQKEVWKTTIGQIGYIYDSKIIADKNGYSYVTGIYSGSLNFGSTVLVSKGSQDMFIAKMDKQGKWQWAISAGGTDTDYGDAISVDDNGMIYIAGRYTGSATFGSTTLTASDIYKTESFLGKLNNNGQWQWAVKAGELGLSVSKNIPVDAAGNIYLAGRFSGTAKFGTLSVTSKGTVWEPDIFVAKCDKDGAWQWAVNTAINQYGQIGIELDGSGNAYVAGRYSGTITFGSTSLSSTPSGNNIFIAKINGSGLWQSAISNSLSQSLSSIIVDKSGNAYIKGMFNNSITFGSLSLSTTENATIFLAKLGNNGQWQWANKVERKWPGCCNFQNSEDLTIDASGNVYILDAFTDFVSINGSKITSTFYYNTFVAKYDNTGQYKWLQNAGYHYSTLGKSLATDNSGGVYLTGTFQNEITFGNTKLKSFATQNGYYPPAYIAKILDDKLTINAGSNTTITCGTSTKLNASGKMYSTLSWSPATGLDNASILTPNASPLTTTIYTITAKNSCGDEVKSQVTVTVNPSFQLNTNADKTTINCGESTKLNTIPSISGQMTYTWSPAEGLSNTTISDPVAKPAYTTTYSVTARSSNGCTATGSVTITVNNPNPPAVGLTTSTGEKFFCNSGITLSAAVGFASYKWNTGETSQSITPSQPGTYSVEVIDNNGCGNKDSITLTPLTKITAPDGPYLCSGQPNASVRLDAGAGFDSYEWNNGQQTQSLTVTTTGTYSVKVTKGSCQYTTSIQVMNHPGSTNAEFTYQSNGLQTQFTALTQGIRFVDWSFGDGNNSSVINPTHIYANPGTYTVCLELTDFCGATDKKCRSITVNGANGINEKAVVEKQLVKIYPNPATDQVIIESEKTLNAPIVITDITGRQVLQIIRTDTNQVTVDISTLTKGLYFININQENYKFIKQ